MCIAKNPSHNAEDFSDPECIKAATSLKHYWHLIIRTWHYAARVLITCESKNFLNNVLE